MNILRIKNLNNLLSFAIQLELLRYVYLVLINKYGSTYLPLGNFWSQFSIWTDYYILVFQNLSLEEQSWATKLNYLFLSFVHLVPPKPHFFTYPRFPFSHAKTAQVNGDGSCLGVVYLHHSSDKMFSVYRLVISTQN